MPVLLECPHLNKGSTRAQRPPFCHYQQSVITLSLQPGRQVRTQTKAVTSIYLLSDGIVPNGAGAPDRALLLQVSKKCQRQLTDKKMTYSPNPNLPGGRMDRSKLRTDGCREKIHRKDWSGFSLELRTPVAPGAPASMVATSTIAV